MIDFKFFFYSVGFIFFVTYIFLGRHYQKKLEKDENGIIKYKSLSAKRFRVICFILFYLGSLFLLIGYVW